MLSSLEALLPCCTKKIEIIQRRAVKWVFSEPYVSYEDDEYLLKLKTLDILPIGYKFLITDLVLFHRMVYRSTCVRLPSYISLVIPSNRPSYLDRLRKRTPKCTAVIHPIFDCLLNPIEHDPCDPLLFKCSIIPRTKVNDSTFFIRSYQEWNKIPLMIRTEENSRIFQEKLTKYIWEILREKIGRSNWPD